jgi:hypothetical protein
MGKEGKEGCSEGNGEVFKDEGNGMMDGATLENVKKGQNKKKN